MNLPLRVLLLSGASVSMIGLGDPAFGAEKSSASSQLSTAIANPDVIEICLADDQCGAGAQSQIAGTDVSLAFHNDVDLSTTVSVHQDGGQTGFGGAWASTGGIYSQAAYATGNGNAAADFLNDGSLAVDVDASALGLTAFAFAGLHDAVRQVAVAPGGGSANVSLSNSGEILIETRAEAGLASGSDPVGDFAQANVIVRGIHQVAAAVASGTSSFTTSAGDHVTGRTNGAAGQSVAALTNNGTLDFSASVAAQADGFAVASAALWGILQDAKGTAVDAQFDNNGTIAIAADASADAGEAGIAFASATGLMQSAFSTRTIHQAAVTADGGFGFLTAQESIGPARASLTNQGSIDVSADARAVAGGGATYAAAFPTARALGARQFTWGGDASGTVDNSGSISVSAHADANAVNGALADASAIGVHQGANAAAGTLEEFFTASGAWDHFSSNFYFAGPASVSFVNSGAIEAAADARAAVSAGSANAVADARALTFGVGGTIGSIDIDNKKTLAASAKASAAGTTGYASAVAAGATNAFSTATGLAVDFANSGTIDVQANAISLQKNGATAFAAGIGADQRGIAYDDAKLSFTNDGAITVHAAAIAQGGYFAGGTAFATGINQHVLTPSADLSFENEGSISVAAGIKAVADADTGFAGVTANAHGYLGHAIDLTAHVQNGGTMDVSARASASGAEHWAAASAVGMAIIGATATTSALYPGNIAGTIDNSGDLNVLAAAKGVTGAGSHTSEAQAVGIQMYSNENAMTISNNGSIVVDAVTQFGEPGKAYSSPARAYGVQIISVSDAADPGAGSVFTLNNKGTIVARQSMDGGTTWTHGLAIDVGRAGNNSVVNLLGGGYIYGGIDVQAGDAINVASGTTVFDGTIDRSCAFTSPGDPNGCGLGTLNITNGGNLLLADARFTGLAAMYDGPSTAFVDTLNVASDGTLTLQLQPATGGAQSAGSYQQVFANTANLAGTLAADFTTQNGLFADSYSWNNVIQANAVTGTFDQCALVGKYAGSPLLDLTCSYDADGSIDLALTRVAFNTVAGLNRNGRSVASAIDAAYDSASSGGFADLAADFFAINGARNYDKALNQVSGSTYANYLQSFPSLAVRFNDVVDDATSCSDRSTATTECRTGKVRSWGQLDYQNRDAGGDAEAGVSRSKRLAALAGIDAIVGQSVVLGLSGGAVSNHLRNVGDTIKGDGYQAGAYGLFDPGHFFVKGIAGYSWFHGDSRRRIDFLSLGGTFAGSLEGRPDVTMWSLGLHGGYRIAAGKQSVLTPYLNLDFAKTKLDGFAETTTVGYRGAELSVSGGHANRLFVSGGVKWAGRIGGVEPEISLGYRHRFGNERSDFSADAIGGQSTAFDVVSSAEKRDAVLAGFSLNGKAGPLDLKLSYDGQFGSKVASNSVNFRVALPLGRGKPK